MTPEQKAYKLAERRIAKAKADDDYVLNLGSTPYWCLELNGSRTYQGDERLTFLTAIPPSLAELQNLGTLVVGGTGVQEPGPIGSLKKLVRLLFTETPVSDVSALAHMPGIRELRLDGTGVTDVTPISSLQELVDLSIRGTKVADITPLRMLENLRVLLMQNTPVTNFETIGRLTTLQAIDLAGALIVNLKPLERLVEVSYLSLSDTQVSDLSPIAGLASLETLNCARTAVQDVSAVAKFTRLNRLDLQGTSVRDLTPLTGLTEMQQLILTDTPVSSIEAIGGMQMLEELALSGTQINNIAPIANLGHLQELSLARTPLKDLSPLHRLAALKTLILDETPVSDLGPLANLSTLESLSIRSTQVSDLQPLACIPTLRTLRMNGSPVLDLTPLSRLEALQDIEFEDTPAATSDPMLDRASRSDYSFDRFRALRNWAATRATQDAPSVNRTLIDVQPNHADASDFADIDASNFSQKRFVDDYRFTSEQNLRLKELLRQLHGSARDQFLSTFLPQAVFRCDQYAFSNHNFSDMEYMETVERGIESRIDAEQTQLESSIRNVFCPFGDDDIPLLIRLYRTVNNPLDRAGYMYFYFHKWVAVHALVDIGSLRATRALMHETYDSSMMGIIEGRR